MMTALPLLLRGVTVLLFLPLCVLLPVAYFRALRPRRGTTEWMRRLDLPVFRPIAPCALHRRDALCAPLAALGAALIWLLLIFLRGGWHLSSEPWLFVRLLAVHGWPQWAAAAVLGLSVYLLLRLWYPCYGVALCGALLSPLMMQEELCAAALLTLALWCLYRWMTAAPQSGWLQRAVLLLAAVMLYGLCLVLCWPCILLAPLLLAAYVRTLLYRWRHNGQRTGSLLLTLALSLLLAWTAVVGVWVLYCFVSGRCRSWNALCSTQLYLELWPTLCVQLSDLFRRPALHLTLTDVLLLLLSVGTLPPLLHGMLRLRDERCLHTLLLLLGLLAVWLFGGVLLSLGVLLSCSWCWAVCTARRRPGVLWGTAPGIGCFMLAYAIWTVIGRI